MIFRQTDDVLFVDQLRWLIEGVSHVMPLEGETGLSGGFQYFDVK